MTAVVQRLCRCSARAAAALLVVLGAQAVGCGTDGPHQLRGAQTHPFWSDSTPRDSEHELDLLRSAGGDVVRVDLSWSSLETGGKGRLTSGYVERVDSFLEQARRRHLKVVAALWSTPCWASSAPAALKDGCHGAWWERGVDRHPPARPEDYAAAAAWVAARWHGKVVALEIWNEPNNQDFLRTGSPAIAYADLLTAAYPRIKAAAPRLTVLAGALAGSDRAFLDRLYARGIQGSYDGVSIHPYSGSRGPLEPGAFADRRLSFLEGVPWIHSAMVARGDAGKGLWLTEMGWSTCIDRSRGCVTEPEQAQYTDAALRIAKRWDYVRAAIVYNLRNKGSQAADRESQFGLVRRNFSPKPAYGAFKKGLADN